MIHFISRYFYEVEHNRVQMLTRAEKKRALVLVCGIALCVTVSVLLWILR